MKLTILGSGSPEPSMRRASTGYLVEIGDDRILLDCGGGVFDNLIRSGRLPSDITHLVFSHLHTDHMMDYARLVHAAWDEGAAPLKVWGPEPIARITDGYFGPDGVLAHDIRARTEFPGSQKVWVDRGGTLPRPWPAPEVNEIDYGDTIEGRGWAISTCEVPHAQPFLKCMALRIDSGGSRFVYSGDAGYSKPLEALCQDADLLLHWCYRLTSDDVHEAVAKFSPTPFDIGAMARRAGVGTLLLTHFRNHVDSEAGRAEALAELAESFGEGAMIVEDLQVYEV